MSDNEDDDDFGLEGLSEVAQILKKAQKGAPVKGLGYAPKRVKDMKAANVDVQRVLKTMIDPTKLSLVQLQEELVRRGLRMNAGTLGNRYQLVGRLQLDNIEKATEIAERGLPEAGMEWAVKKTLLDKWRDEQAIKDREARTKKWTELKKKTETAKYAQAIKIAPVVDPETDYSEVKLTLPELKDKIFKVIDKHLRQIKAEDNKHKEELQRYDEYWRKREMEEAGEIFVPEDTTEAERKREKTTLVATARAAITALEAVKYARGCLKRAKEAVALLEEKRAAEKKAREIKELPPIVWDRLTLTVGRVRLARRMTCCVRIEVDDKSATCTNKVVGKRSHRTDTCADTSWPRFLDAQSEFRLEKEMGEQLPGLRFNIFLDEVVLDSDRRIQFCPVGKAVANVRYMGKVVKEGSPPGFLWLKFHSARNRKGVLELPLEVVGDCFLFVRGPSAYFPSAIAMRHVLNRELRLRDWQQGDGFNYHYNRIHSLTVYDQTANTLRNYTCSQRSVNWVQYFEHPLTDAKGARHERCFATCDAENRIVLWDLKSGAQIQEFARRGFEAGQTNAARASQQQMDQVNGHIGPVNGCLFLPVTSIVETTPLDDVTDESNAKRSSRRSLKKLTAATTNGTDGDEDVDSDEDFNSDETLSSSSSEESSLSSSDEESEQDAASAEQDRPTGRAETQRANASESKRPQPQESDSPETDPDEHDKYRMLSWSADGTIKVWGLTSGKVLETLTGHGGAVTQVALSPNAMLLASSSADRTVRLWAARPPYRTLFVFRGHLDTVNSCCWSLDGTQIFSVGGYSDRQIFQWDVAFGLRIAARELLQLKANRRWRGQEKELGFLQSDAEAGGRTAVFPNLEVILEMASSNQDAGTKKQDKKPMNEFYAHYGLPQSFYERCFASEFVKDGVLPDEPYVGSGTKPQPKLSSLLKHQREELLSIATNKADAVTDAVSDAASAAGEVAVELVAMMKRAGAAQRDQMQKRHAKQILKSLQKKYADLVAAKVKRDRAAKQEQLLLQQKEKDREATAKELVLRQDLKAQMERIAGEVVVGVDSGDDSSSKKGQRERAEDEAVPDSENRGAGDNTNRDDHSDALDLVGQRQLAERVQARELALDEAERVPYLHVPNVRAGVANNHYWQYEQLVTLENECTQCQGCFPEPPWWHHGKPKPEAKFLVDKGEGHNVGDQTSYAVAYLKPTCSRFSLIRPPITDWRAHIDEQIIKVKQQEVKRVDHAAEKAAKEEEKFAKLTRLEQELELMRREREAEKEAKRKKKEEERLARLERQRQKDVKKLKLDAELAAALDEYLQSGGDGVTGRHPATLMEFQRAIQALKEDDKFLDSKTLWCGNKARKNGWCGLVVCQLQAEAERRAEIAARKALEAAIQRIENDPVVKAEFEARVATARGAWLVEYSEEIVAAKQRGETLEFDPEPVLAHERNIFVVEELRAARKKAREECMAQRPACVPALDPSKHGGAARTFEVRIPTHGFFGHTDGINCCSISPNGRTLATGGDDCAVKLWETSSGLLLRSIDDAHSGVVRCVSFFADSRTLATASDDQTIRIWDSFVGALIQVIRGHTDVVTHISLNQQQVDLLSASGDGTARAWRLVPRPPDPPQEVVFRKVRTDIFEHTVRMELAWDMPISFGAPVMQYFVLRRKIRKQAVGDGTALLEFPWGNLQVVDVAGNLRDGRNLVVTDLKPGSVYQYVVAAESAMGVGTFSEPVQQRMPPAVPARIEQPKILEISTTFMDIFWTEPDGYGANVRFYELRIRGGLFRTFEDCPPIYLDKKKCQKRADERRLVQENRVERMFDNERKRHEAEMDKAERFSAARKARVKARIRTAMTFMHRRMEDELARQLMLDEEFGMPSDATGKECVHRVEGLKAGQTFQFQVRAINHVGRSKWSPASAATHTKATVPRRPKPVVLHDTTTESLHISWELPDERGSRIDEVFVYEAIEPGEVCSLSSLRGRLIPSHTTHTVFKGFRPGTRHFFRIRCKNACGWSEDSLANAAPGFRTVPTAPEPCLPPKLGGPPLSTALSLCWAPPLYDNGEPVTAFELAVLEDTRVSEWEVLGQFSVDELSRKAVPSNELNEVKQQQTVASSSLTGVESKQKVDEFKNVQPDVSTDDPAPTELSQTRTATDSHQPKVHAHMPASQPKEATSDPRTKTTIAAEKSSTSDTTGSQDEANVDAESKQETPHAPGSESANSSNSEEEAVVAKAFLRAVAKLPTKQLRKRLSASLMVPDDEQGHRTADLQGVGPGKSKGSTDAAASTTETSAASGNTQTTKDSTLLSLDAVQRMLRAEIVAHLLELHLKEYRTGVSLGDDDTSVSDASVGQLSHSHSQPRPGTSVTEDKRDSNDPTPEQTTNQSGAALEQKRVEQNHEPKDAAGPSPSLPSNTAGQCTPLFFKTVENLRPEHMYNFRVRALNSVGFSDWSAVSPPFFTATATTPDQMGKIEVSEVTPRSCVLRWEKPGDGGLPILGFRVFKFDIPDSTTTAVAMDDGAAEEAELVFEGPHNSIGAKIEKLQPEGSYQFAVECFNGIGMSELSQRTDIVKCPRNVDYILAQQKALMQQPGWRPGRNVGELGEEKLRVSDAPRGMYAS